MFFHFTQRYTLCVLLYCYPTPFSVLIVLKNLQDIAEDKQSGPVNDFKHDLFYTLTRRRTSLAEC